MAHFDNLPSILDRGILSHEACQHIEHRSVADEEVQARRATRAIPQGLRLHQYANLYFNARNAMLFRILRNTVVERRVPSEEIAILRIAPAVLDLHGVVVTDINAAAAAAPRWHPVADGIARLDADTIFAQYWDSYEHRQRMMAEVLVPHRVSVEMIVGAYVNTAATAANLSVVAPTLAIEVNSYMFFEGTKP